jgi:hypothetical protein
MPLLSVFAMSLYILCFCAHRALKYCQCRGAHYYMLFIITDEFLLLDSSPTVSNIDHVLRLLPIQVLFCSCKKFCSPMS